MTDAAVDKLADGVEAISLGASHARAAVWADRSDLSKLTPLSPEVIRNQATINIGS